MRHMVLMTHGAGTCPAGHPEMQEKCGSRLMQLKEGSTERGLSIQDFWANPTGHVFYALADAPSAHSIAELAGELELSHWNTVDVQPVAEM